MSLGKKKSSASLSRQSIGSNNDRSVYLNSADSNKIEKQFKRMSTIFHRSKTEDSAVDSKYAPSLISMNSSSPSEIPLPRSNGNEGIYSLRNNSSGTLIGRNLSLDIPLSTNNNNNNPNITNVEFTNVRNSMGHFDSSDSLPSPSSSSLFDKTKDSKLGRFFSKTGQKVKKISDLNSNESSSLHLGLGLHLHSNTHHYHHNHFAEFNLSNKDLKSPVGRNFNKLNNEQKMTFGDKLKMLNSTKYKNYHYHKLLKNKKDSLRNGIKLGSKGNDSNVTGYNNSITGSSIALNNINYNEIQLMIDNNILNFEQYDDYCQFLYNRIQNLLLPLFKGEELKCPMEDVTKVVSLYVRLRKGQEECIKDSDDINGNTSNVNSSGNNNGNNSNLNIGSLGHSQSQNSLGSAPLEDLNEYETPFMKPTAIFGNSPMNNELTSPMGFSPMGNLRAVMSFNARSKVLEEINEIIKYCTSVMVNQLYYDEPNDHIKFIKGPNSLLRKRKNTMNSLNNKNDDPFSVHSIPINHTSSTNTSSTLLNKNNNNSLYNIDMTHNISSRSIMDLPILTPIPTHSSAFNESSFGDKDDTYSYACGYDINNNLSSKFSRLQYDDNGDNMNTLLNLGMLPPGRFETCTNILWDIFERNILYELTSILLPIELEFATGHRGVSKIHNRADAILYNNGEKIITFTNTLVHPDISGIDILQNASVKEKNEIIKASVVGTLGEWCDFNIHNLILIGFRDNIVIPLFELNRNYEDLEGNVVGITNTKSQHKDPMAELEEYTELCSLLECFQRLCSVETNDTNQKLVENLLVQLRDRIDDE